MADPDVVRVAVAVNPDQTVAAKWGRAPLVATATIAVDRCEVVEWDVHEVNWDQSAARGSHAAHHARVLQFLRQQRVDLVAGPSRIGLAMARSLSNAGLRADLAPSGGPARARVLTAVCPGPRA